MDIVAIIVSGFGYLLALLVFLVVTSLADGSLSFDVFQRLSGNLFTLLPRDHAAAGR